MLYLKYEVTWINISPWHELKPCISAAFRQQKDWKKNENEVRCMYLLYHHICGIPVMREECTVARISTHFNFLWPWHYLDRQWHKIDLISRLIVINNFGLHVPHRHKVYLNFYFGISIKSASTPLILISACCLPLTSHLFHLIQRSREATTHLMLNLFKCQVLKMSATVQAHTPIHLLSLNANTPCKWMHYPPLRAQNSADKHILCASKSVCVCRCLDLCAQIYAYYGFTTRDWRSLHLYVCMCESVCVCAPSSALGAAVWSLYLIEWRPTQPEHSL